MQPNFQNSNPWEYHELVPKRELGLKGLLMDPLPFATYAKLKDDY